MGSINDNTIVVIPSYNEARTIGDIVLDIVNMGMSVLVIDDGSNDNTERLALDAGAMVLRHKVNVGKGYSVRQAINYVLDKTKYEWLLIMDGDGQHHTEDIASFMEATTPNGDVDMVLGNRMSDAKGMPPVRYWTNKFTSGVLSWICKHDIPDSQCGYRLVSTDAVRKMNLETEKYDIESEMLIEAAEMRMNVVSVPIQTIYGDEVSEIHPVRDTIKFFELIIKSHFRLSEVRRKKKKRE